MKMTCRILEILLLIISLLAFHSCNKKKPVPPVLNTIDISLITPINAYSGGQITDDGGSTIITKGVCWDINENPTIETNLTLDGSGPDNFLSFITGLSANTNYYVRAYATNSAGIGYGQQIHFKTSIDHTGETGFLNDIEGNIYPTIGVGGQLWMAENLKTKKLNDGTNVLTSIDNTSWNYLGTPSCCWYNNDQQTWNDYGLLYNWYAVNSGKLCPINWHVPTTSELAILNNFLGNSESSGSKIKETGIIHWEYPNTGATNESGFTALPGGLRGGYGSFESINKYAYWWTSTEYNKTIIQSGWYYSVSYNSSNLNIGYMGRKSFGLSVRCVKD